MPKPLFAISLVSGVVLCLLIPVIGFVGLAVPQGEGPFLVLSLPSDGGAAAIIDRAGGAQVGPVSTIFAALSANASATDLMAAGAISVLPAAALSFLCSTETSQ